MKNASLKVDLHIHTSEDKEDCICYSANDLVDAAVLDGFDALAITNHDKLTDDDDLRSYAAERGIVLIPGVEATVEGRHILLINMPYEEGRYQSFEDILHEKSESSLVVAPHPYFPGSSCLNGRLEASPHLFDAVEVCHFYSEHLNFNKPAIRYARTHKLPMVANSDAHLLEQFGLAYSLVEAEKTADGIIQAIKAGRVEPVSQPLSVARLIRIYLRVAAVKRLTWHRPFELTYTGGALMKSILERRL